MHHTTAEASVSSHANYLGRVLRPDRLVPLSAKTSSTTKLPYTYRILVRLLLSPNALQARRHGSQVALLAERILFESRPRYIRDFQVQASAHLYANRSLLQAAFALHRTKHEACFPETLLGRPSKRTLSTSEKRYINFSLLCKLLRKILREFSESLVG